MTKKNYNIFGPKEDYLKINAHKILEIFEKKRISFAEAWIEVAKNNGIEISKEQARRAHAITMTRGKSEKREEQFKYRQRVRNLKNKLYGSPDASVNQFIVGFSYEKSLAAVAPELEKLWDYDRNDKLGLKRPNEILPSSNKKAYFFCKKGHLELKKINDKFRNRDGKYGSCKYCSGKAPHNDFLLINHPDYETKYKSQWHVKLNKENGHSVDNVYFHGTSGKKSDYKKKYWWKCNLNENHENYLMDMYHKIKRDQKCPNCMHKGNPPYEDSLKGHFPEILEIWDENKNKKTPDQIWAKHPDEEIHIKCQKCLNDFKTVPWNLLNASYKNNIGCPYCSGKKAWSGHNLKKELIDKKMEYMIDEFDKDKNKLNIEDYAPQSNKKIWWKCRKCNHSWQTQGNWRLNDRSNCSKCMKAFGMSPFDIFLRMELKEFFNDIDIYSGNVKELPKKRDEQDCFIPQLKLLINFDSEKYHSGEINNERDKRRVGYFKNYGYDMIRVRHNLEKITENDIVLNFSRPLQAGRHSKIFKKQVIDKLLIKINDVYDLNLDLNEYLKKDDLLKKNEAFELTENIRLKKYFN